MHIYYFDHYHSIFLAQHLDQHFDMSHAFMFFKCYAKGAKVVDKQQETQIRSYGKKTAFLFIIVVV